MNTVFVVFLTQNIFWQFLTAFILSDSSFSFFLTVQFATFRSSTFFTLFHRNDRPLELKRPSTIILDHWLWLKWLSALAQDHPLLIGPSTLRTVYFGSLGPSTFDLIRTQHVQTFDDIDRFWPSIRHIYCSNGNKHMCGCLLTYIFI